AKTLSQWTAGQPIIVNPEMATLTMTIVMKCLFGTDLSGVPAITETMDVFRSVISTEMREAIPLPDWLPIQRKRDMKRVIETFNQIIFKIIGDRRASGDDHGDLMSMLLLAVDEDGSGMSNQQLRDEIIT